MKNKMGKVSHFTPFNLSIADIYDNSAEGRIIDI
jgi:hypothetical protein